jgi:predicted PhzF superfamily epimerase YddE/YHI9
VLNPWAPIDLPGAHASPADHVVIQFAAWLSSDMSTTLHVLRVFADGQARFGNPLGVFLDGAAVPVETRQQVAARLGFSETVFVDDVDTGAVDIRTPAAELPFAGHPLVGTAWLLAQVDLTEPFVDHWAWIDEEAGIIRSRVFAPGVGIAEDEATGAAAVRLVTELGRPVRIVQGNGSELFARPGPQESAEVGGRAVLVETRDDSGR